MFQKGKIEVIAGSMFCGKTEELIRRVRRAKIARQNTIAFKPMIDNRYKGVGSINSHNGDSLNCIPIKHPSDVADNIQPSSGLVVAFDEAQFFDTSIVDLVRHLSDHGVRVILAGLDTDFRREPFGEAMPQLLAIADEVTKLTAVCVKCGEEATCTQRLVNGVPARWDDPIILIGEQDSYEARCRDCHELIREDNPAQSVKFGV